MKQSGDMCAYGIIISVPIRIMVGRRHLKQDIHSEFFERNVTKMLDHNNIMPQFSPEGIDKNQELIKLLLDMAEKKHATPAQISLAWMLAKKPWIVPIPGTRKYDRLVENAQSTDVILTDLEVKTFDQIL